MAKLFFKTGTMGSSKSLDLIRAEYNYREKGLKTLVFKPSQDCREGSEKCIIKSRAGLSVEGEWIYPGDDIFKYIKLIHSKNKVNAVFIDEVQFLTEQQIKQLQDVVYDLEIPVLAYGLKTDFKGNLFIGAAKLIALADEIDIIPSICWCGKKAKQNARVLNGKLVTEGDVIQIGGDESYIALCNKHFRNMDIGNYEKR